MKSSMLIGFILLFVGIFAIANGQIKYSKAEKEALAKFRPMVKKILLEDYMDKDEYLIRFLRTKKLNLDESKEFLQATMNWRKENRMNEILKEDFSKFKKEYPVFLEGIDKDGRPVRTYLFGLYDLRKVAIAGEMEQFQRYLNRNFEETDRRIRELNGQNITQSVSIYDLYGFNSKQHLCLQCLAIYTYFTRTYENYYPMQSHVTYFVNMPTIFEQVLQVVRPLFSEHTRNSIHFLGLDREVWKKELLKQIPVDQLFRQFGGNKVVKPGTQI